MTDKKTLNQLLKETKDMDPIASMNHLTKGMQELSKDGLEKAKEEAEKQADKKSFRDKLFNRLTFTRYERSPTFFQPTRIVYEIGPGTISFLQMKAEGIKRPHVRNILKRKNVKKLYHHESGVVGILEKNRDGLHTALRIPFRIVEEVGLKNLVNDFPGIQKGLEYDPQFSVSGIKAYSEGDIVYIKTQDLEVPKRKISEIEKKLLSALPEEMAKHMALALMPGMRELEQLMQKELSYLKTTLNSIATQTDKIFPRNKKELKDYASAEDLKREYNELKDTPIGMISMNPNKFVFPEEPYLVGGLIGRVFGTDRAELNTEIRLPIALIGDLKREEKQTRIDLIDQYMKPYIMTLEGLSSKEKNGKIEHSVKLVGDLVYDTTVPNKESYNALKKQVNDIGKKYLEGRMPFYGMF